MYKANKLWVNQINKTIKKKKKGGDKLKLIVLKPSTQFFVFVWILLIIHLQFSFYFDCRASKAATMILNLTALHNGASLTVEDPGTLPNPWL